ncbi:AraC family transcriptional regulator [Paenibacillus alba]|uniref:AraC family transcriptional regulator n=1 Tax=Paenibacillus alba TaxID=1197127 RepID=A0ABU6G043_9BACL|nr:AraC family transcriptional regulator [Paenibacillus alba]MEC0226164.1 AraC family transcriptional regulator [Paenibacillus alba]
MYIYDILEVKIIDLLSNKLVVPTDRTGHRIICFARTGGNLRLAGHILYADQGSCMLLAPGDKAEIEISGGSDLLGAVYMIRFHAYGMGEKEPSIDIGPCVPYETKIDVRPLSRLVDLLEQVAHRASDALRHEYVERCKQQIHLQELLVLLMENVQTMHSFTDATSAVQQTINYLNHNYREEITVELLSRMSGVGRWKYSDLFQSLIGKKPLEYLTEVRINRAKELLLQTDDPLREIARRVGFKDEYYFSRKFRHEMGMTPKQYVRTKSNKGTTNERSTSPFTRVVAVGAVLGDLLALGIRPIGADMTVIGKKVVYREELNNIADVGLLGEPGKVKALNPDLIVYSGFRLDWIDKLSDISPIVAIDRFEHTYDRLLKVADLFGRTNQARNWVESHEQRSNEIWKRLFANPMDKRKQATIFVVNDGVIYVMGMRGVAFTLYHPLAFEPSDKVKDLIARSIPFFAIEPEMIKDYGADHLFLLVDEYERSKRKAQSVTNHPYWKSMGEDCVHILEGKWNFDDPITMDRLLPLLPRIIRSI